jgi:pimeloyl-ACP methyl ester carboxylesterase
MSSASFWTAMMPWMVIMADPVRRGYVDFCGGQLHYYRCGRADTGTPLLCLHMSPGSGMVYEKFLASIGDSRLALAVDIPGFGNSSVPSSEPEIEAYACAIGEVVDAFGFTKLHLMGYHLGTSVAIELARQRPSQVQRIVAVSVPLVPVAEREQEVCQPVPHALRADGSHLRDLWQETAHKSMPGVTTEALARTFPESLLNPTTNHWGDLAASRYSLADALADVDKPILVLNPEDDYSEQTSQVGPYLQHRESRVEELRGWGNGFLEVRAQTTATLVEQFLEDH